MFLLNLCIIGSIAVKHTQYHNSINSASSLYIHALLLLLFLYQIVVVSHILVHDSVEPHPSVLVLAVHVSLLKVDSGDVLALQSDDNHIPCENGFGVLLLYDRHYQMATALLFVLAADGGYSLGFGEGVDEDVREQVAELVCNDVVLF